MVAVAAPALRNRFLLLFLPTTKPLYGGIFAALAQTKVAFSSSEYITFHRHPYCGERIAPVRPTRAPAQTRLVIAQNLAGYWNNNLGYRQNLWRYRRHSILSISQSEAGRNKSACTSMLMPNAGATEIQIALSRCIAERCIYGNLRLPFSAISLSF